MMSLGRQRWFGGCTRGGGGGVDDAGRSLESKRPPNRADRKGARAMQAQFGEYFSSIIRYNPSVPSS